MAVASHSMAASCISELTLSSYKRQRKSPELPFVSVRHHADDRLANAAEDAEMYKLFLQCRQPAAKHRCDTADCGRSRLLSCSDT